jgi:hypothetical protein
MSSSTNDNLGRRRFQLHRDKAVEYAMERIRRAVGCEWDSLPAEEREGLKATLAEIWMSTSQERWHQYCFSTVTRHDILELASLWRDIQAWNHMTEETRRAFESILLSCSGNTNHT